MAVVALVVVALFCRERRKTAGANAIFNPSANMIHSMALRDHDDPARPLRDADNEDGGYVAPTV
jgi:hypothetical protein